MKRHVAVLLLLLPLSIVLAGCEPPTKVAKANAGPPAPPPPPGGQPPAAPAPPAAVPVSTPMGNGQAPLPVETKAGIFAGDLNDLARGPAYSQPVQSTTQPDDPNLERVKAGKGVGLKGRSLDEYEGVYVTPAKTLFTAKERIFFEIEFKANYDRWIILEDKVPQDFDDLKSRFLDPLGLSKNLPVLPQGHKYIWNKETQELEVERPRRKTQ